MQNGMEMEWKWNGNKRPPHRGSKIERNGMEMEWRDYGKHLY